MKQLATIALTALGMLAGALNPALAAQRVQAMDTMAVPAAEMDALRQGLLSGAELRTGTEITSPVFEEKAAASAGIGGIAGALLGAVAFSLAVDWSDCATPESMCGMQAPLYVGVGALAGAVAGYFFDLGRSEASA